MSVFDVCGVDRRATLKPVRCPYLSGSCLVVITRGVHDVDKTKRTSTSYSFCKTIGGNHYHRYKSSSMLLAIVIKTAYLIILAIFILVFYCFLSFSEKWMPQEKTIV